TVSFGRVFCTRQGAFTMKPVSHPLTIRPGAGLGDIVFGSSRDEVRRHLGEPDDTSENLLPEHPGVLWTHAKLGITAISPGYRAYNLHYLIVENEASELFGQRLIGLPEEQVCSLLGPFNLGDPESAQVQTPGHPDVTWLIYHRENLWFEFEQG